MLSAPLPPVSVSSPMPPASVSTAFVPVMSLSAPSAVKLTPLVPVKTY
jgi:hypothetical protein